MYHLQIFAILMLNFIELFNYSYVPDKYNSRMREQQINCLNPLPSRYQPRTTMFNLGDSSGSFDERLITRTSFHAPCETQSRFRVCRLSNLIEKRTEEGDIPVRKIQNVFYLLF